MAKLKIEIPVRLFDENKYKKTIDFFSNKTISLVLCKKETVFKSRVVEKIELDGTYTHEINGVKKLIELFPKINSLKDDLKKYEEMAKKHLKYDVNVYFEGEIAAEIDIQSDSIMHYTGPLKPKLDYKSIPKLKKMIVSDRFEEYYEENIKKFMFSIIIASVLSDPSIELNSGKINLYVDDAFYRSEMFISSPLHTEAFDKYGFIIKTKITFNDTIDWIKKYTNLYQSKQKPPVIFMSLTYVLNREDHESLLYSILGLESIYVPKEKGVSYSLQKRINYLFPEITKEQIKKMYDKRSDFVHGKEKMDIYKDYRELIKGNFSYEDVAILATALLIETNRMLIAKNAVKISFEEKLSHSFTK